MKKPVITVLGLCGRSVFLKVNHFHHPGETLHADTIHIEPGGKGYNQAVDSLNRYGMKRYGHLVSKYCKVREEHIDSVLKDLKYYRIAAPRTEDVEYAVKWLEKQ